MSKQAFVLPESTITIVPSGDRPSFIIAYAQGFAYDRSFIRDVTGAIQRSKDSLRIEAVWVEEEEAEYFKAPAISEWLVEWANEDGRTFTDRWKSVNVKSAHRSATGDDGVVVFSVEAEGEPVLD